MEVIAKNMKTLALIAIVIAATMPTLVRAEPESVPAEAEVRIDTIDINATPARGVSVPVDAEPLGPTVDTTPVDDSRITDVGNPEIVPVGPTVDSTPIDDPRVNDIGDPEIVPTGPSVDSTPIDDPRVTDIGNPDIVPTDPTDGDSGSNGGSGGGNGGGGRRAVNNNNPGQVLGVEDFKFLNNLKMTMKTSDVMELQKRLRAEGHFTFPTDTGYFGPITYAAVKSYQAAHPKDIGFVTGFVGPLTRGMLNK